MISIVVDDSAYSVWPVTFTDNDIRNDINIARNKKPLWKKAVW